MFSRRVFAVCLLKYLLPSTAFRRTLAFPLQSTPTKRFYPLVARQNASKLIARAGSQSTEQLTQFSPELSSSMKKTVTEGCAVLARPSSYQKKSLSPSKGRFWLRSKGLWAENMMDKELKSVTSILQASFLLTGSSIGAGITILPDVARDAGLGITIPLVLGLYALNLISGIAISDVAIKQYRAMETKKVCQDVAPSSYLQLTETALGEAAATAVSSLSVLANWSILAFALMQAGHFLGGLNDSSTLNDNILSVVFSMVIALLVSSSSNQDLSKITSAAVMVLFGSFTCTVIPGLRDMQDPLLTVSTPGTHGGGELDAVLSAGPIFLTSLIFQHMVPLVSKMLSYDRFAIIATMAIGSGVPVVMYLLWCLAMLGGGVDGSSIDGGPLMALFSAAALIGSSVGGTMCLAAEIRRILVRIADAKDEHSTNSPVHSVLLAVFPPLTAGILFSDGEAFTTALKCAGTYASPLLYGLLPVALSLAQGQREQS